MAPPASSPARIMCSSSRRPCRSREPSMSLSERMKRDGRSGEDRMRHPGNDVGDSTIVRRLPDVTHRTFVGLKRAWLVLTAAALAVAGPAMAQEGQPDPIQG